MNPESEGGELEEGGEGKTRRDDVLQLLESQRASVGEVKAEAEERELELIGKVKELEEEYERFMEELVTLVGYGEKGEKRVEVVEKVAALIQAEINLKKQVNSYPKICWAKKCDICTLEGERPGEEGDGIQQDHPGGRHHHGQVDDSDHDGLGGDDQERINIDDNHDYMRINIYDHDMI